MRKTIICALLLLSLLSGCNNNQILKEKDLELNYISFTQPSGSIKLIQKFFPNMVFDTSKTQLLWGDNDNPPFTFSDTSKEEEFMNTHALYGWYFFDNDTNYYIMFDKEEDNDIQNKQAFMSKSNGKVKLKNYTDMGYKVKLNMSVQIDLGYPEWVKNPLYYSGGHNYQKLPLDFTCKVIKIKLSDFEVIE